MISSCAVSVNSAAAGPTDTGCGQAVTPTRAEQCEVTIVAYAAPASVSSTTTVSAISTTAGVNSVFGTSTGSQAYDYWPAPETGATTTTATWTTVGSIAANTTYNFGCRIINPTGSGKAFSCDVSWVCF